MRADSKSSSGIELMSEEQEAPKGTVNPTM